MEKAFIAMIIREKNRERVRKENSEMETAMQAKTGYHIKIAPFVSAKRYSDCLDL